MHRTIIRAAVLAVALLLAAPAAAALADTLPRNFAYRVQSLEQKYEWTEIDEEHPDNCESWATGGGTIRITVPAYTGLLKLDEGYGGKVTGHSGSRDMRAPIERTIRYVGHIAPEEGCTPCGRGEYGPCAPTVPDRTVTQGCPKTGLANPYLTANAKAIAFEPSIDFDDTLNRCPQLRWPASNGPIYPRFGQMWAMTGTRQLLRLKIGQTRTIVFKSRRGTCSKLGRDGFNDCATSTARVKFRRTF